MIVSSVPSSLSTAAMRRASSPGLDGHVGGPVDRVEFERPQGLAHILVGRVEAEAADTPGEKEGLGKAMLAQLGAWPMATSVITVVEGTPDQTELLVASRQRAARQSVPEGVYEVNQRLASSDSIKSAARQWPTQYHAVTPIGDSGQVHSVVLPGPQTRSSVEKALREGKGLNRYDQLDDLVRDLPQGKRVAVLVGGGSAAGKSTLIARLREAAGDRKVTAIEGDMYFRDVDETGLPLTPKQTPFWDHPGWMDIPLLKEQLSRLLQDGKAELPKYNFVDSPPGPKRANAPEWRVPTPYTGFREDATQPIEVGADDIIVLDSIHATHPEVVEHLEKLGLEHRSLYLDSPRAEDRLLRRIVRDYEARGGRSAETSLEIWDQTTFPGETGFIREGILKLDPGRDLALTFQFPADLGLSREEIDRKAAQLARYGLSPSYGGFGTPDSQLGRFAQAEKARLQAVLATETDEKARTRASRELAALHASPEHQATLVQAPHPEITQALQEKLGSDCFHIEKDRAEALARELGLTMHQLLVELIPVAKAHARPPISEYLVGAVGLGKSGDVYLGVNLEIPNRALNQSVHGEQFVTANALNHGETELETIAVSAAPCGHCRQFLNELQDSENLTVLVPGQPPRKLPQLLIDNFGPKDLGVQGALLSSPEFDLHLHEGAGDPVAQAALHAAEHSYSPYSKSPSGVAILAKGHVYAGSYAENAAFNPSLSPLQSALTSLVQADVAYSDIERVVLVEKAQTRPNQAGQEGATRLVMESINPQARVEVYHAE